MTSSQMTDLNFGLLDDLLSEFILLFDMTGDSALYAAGPRRVAEAVSTVIKEMRKSFVRGYVTIVLAKGRKYYFAALHHPIHAVMHPGADTPVKREIPLVKEEDAAGFAGNFLVKHSKGLYEIIPDVMKKVRLYQEKEEAETGRVFYSEFHVYTCQPADEAMRKNPKEMQNVRSRCNLITSVYYEGDRRDGEELCDIICNSSDYYAPKTEDGIAYLIEQMTNNILFMGEIHRFNDNSRKPDYDGKFMVVLGDPAESRNVRIRDEKHA